MEWFVFGVIVGAGGYGLAVWLRRTVVRITWYEWTLGVIALVLALLALQNLFASRAEMEDKAGWMGLLFLGLPAVVLAAIVGGLVWRRGTVAQAPKES